jgi:NADH-quinone oxidoreductase subunit A
VELSNYAPLLIQFLIAAVMGSGIIAASHLFGQRSRGGRIKDSAYECGMLSDGKPSTRFSVKFYVTAMLFILFDIEVVFLYPWAVVYREMLVTHANLIFGAMLTFLGVLFVGYLYALKKGAFDWKS